MKGGRKQIIISTVVGLVFIGFLSPPHSSCDINNTVILGQEFLEEGFPIFIPLQGGLSFFPDYMKVANIDSDEELEIILKPLNTELCAWNHDGTIVNGWPLTNTYIDGGFVLGEFDKSIPGLEIFYGFGSSYAEHPPSMAIYSGSGNPIYGWPFPDDPCTNTNYPDCIDWFSFSRPTATDLNNDGIDELVIKNGVTDEIVVFRANGLKYDYFSPPPRPPEVDFGGWGEYASGDIDGDGVNEIISCYPTNSRNDCFKITAYLFAYNRDGSVLDGFPIMYYSAGFHQPLLTDVNGDDTPEIVLLSATSCAEEIEYDAKYVFKIIDGTGSVLSQMIFGQDPKLTGPSSLPFFYLGDLNNDQMPEIIFVTQNGHDRKLWAYKIDGTVMPGWPVEGDEAGVAIGDIDGDQLPEIVTLLADNSSHNNRNYLVVYEHDGSKKDHSILIDYMAIRGDVSQFQPVIADIDNDDRNEVIVLGEYWDGQAGYFPQIWAFDFGGDNHGAIQFGQYGVDAKNTKWFDPSPGSSIIDKGDGKSILPWIPLLLLKD